MEKMEEQAKTRGAVIKTGEEVIEIEKKNDLFLKDSFLIQNR